MTKPDDHTLTEAQYRKVQRYAQKALEQAGALGRFPTPIKDIMAAAKVTLAPDNILDEDFLKQMRQSVSQENASALKSALSKVLGLFDARANLIFIDGSVSTSKQTFLKLHETGHAVLPWQKSMYEVVETCDLTLEPDTAELFDREANTFATEVLFQMESFITEAQDLPFGLRTPMDLSKKYGSSLYAAIRQYVRKHHIACALIVLDPLQPCASNMFRASLRRIEYSQSFKATFAHLQFPPFFTPNDEIGALIPVGGRKMSSPRTIVLTNDQGELQTFLGEAFSTPYNTFILIRTSPCQGNNTFFFPGVANF